MFLYFLVHHFSLSISLSLATESGYLFTHGLVWVFVWYYIENPFIRVLLTYKIIIHVFFIGNYFGFNVLKLGFKLFNNCCVHFDTFFVIFIVFCSCLWFFFVNFLLVNLLCVCVHNASHCFPWCYVLFIFYLENIYMYASSVTHAHTNTFTF